MRDRTTVLGALIIGASIVAASIDWDRPRFQFHGGSDGARWVWDRQDDRLYFVTADDPCFHHYGYWVPFFSDVKSQAEIRAQRAAEKPSVQPPKKVQSPRFDEFGLDDIPASPLPPKGK